PWAAASAVCSVSRACVIGEVALIYRYCRIPSVQHSPDKHIASSRHNEYYRHAMVTIGRRNTLTRRRRANMAPDYRYADRADQAGSRPVGKGCLLVALAALPLLAYQAAPVPIAVHRLA